MSNDLIQYVVKTKATVKEGGLPAAFHDNIEEAKQDIADLIEMEKRTDVELYKTVFNNNTMRQTMIEKIDILSFK